MPASTLALGQSTYELLDIDGDDYGDYAENVSVSKRGSSALIRNDEPGGSPVENFGIGVTSANIQDSSSNDNINIRGDFNDLTVDVGRGRDAVNISGDLSDVQLILDDQNSAEQFNDRLYIRGDVQSSESNISDIRNGIWTGGGNDTVRISGQVNDTDVALGAGNDSLLVDGSSERLYVSGDEGRDFIELRDSADDAIIQAGDDNDTVVLRGNLYGTGFSSISESYDQTAAVDLGDGNDSLVLGGGSENAQVNTGSGSDTVRLSGFVGSTDFYLDGPSGSSQSEVEEGNLLTLSNVTIPSNVNILDIDSALTQSEDDEGGDLLTLSNGTIFDNVSVSSSFSGIDGDTMVVGAQSSFYDSEFILSSGNDSLVFGSEFVDMDSYIDLGSGSDTVVFGSNALLDGTVIDLGSDNQEDVIRFDSWEDFDSIFDYITIEGVGDGDILFIGYDEFHYHSDSNSFFEPMHDDDDQYYR